MTSIWLFIISFIPPLILCWLIVWSRRRNYPLRTIILGATLVHEILLVVFPVIYSVFTDYDLEKRMIVSVTAEDLLLVMAGESIFVLMFAVGLTITLPGSTPQNDDLMRSKSNRMSERTERLIIYMLIVVGCLVYASQVFSYALNIESDALNAMVRYLTGVFWYSSLVACAFLATKQGGLSINPVRTLLAAIPLLSLVVIGITSGVRGRIMWAVSLLLVAGIFNKQKKIIVFSLIMATLLFPIFAVLGDRDTRGAMVSASSQAEIFTLVFEAGKKNINNYQELMEVFLDSFSWRAQGVRNSVTLYQDVEHGGGGFKTYLGAFFAFVPRSLWPEKPMLGSLDHTEFESAMYKVMDMGYGEEGTMGPMLASAHAYWEGGFIWLVVAGLITGMFWNTVFRYCMSLPDSIAAVIILTFAAALMIDGLLTMLVPLYAFIIRCWLSLLPLLIIYKGIFVITQIGYRARTEKNII